MRCCDMYKPRCFCLQYSCSVDFIYIVLLFFPSFNYQLLCFTLFRYDIYSLLFFSLLQLPITLFYIVRCDIYSWLFFDRLCCCQLISFGIHMFLPLLDLIQLYVWVSLSMWLCLWCFTIFVNAFSNICMFQSKHPRAPGSALDDFPLCCC